MQDTARLLFTLSFLISVGGSIVVMSGLAAMTAFCWDNQPLGLGAGFKLTVPVSALELVHAGLGLTAACKSAPCCACDSVMAVLVTQHLSLCMRPPLAQEYTTKVTEVMRIEKATVTSTTGTFQCDKFFR